VAVVVGVGVGVAAVAVVVVVMVVVVLCAQSVNMSFDEVPWIPVFEEKIANFAQTPIPGFPV
jgi:hypothetical protein